MPNPAARRPRPAVGSSRGRTILVIAALALFVLITSLRGIAGFYTDYLWFDGLGLSSVFRATISIRSAGLTTSVSPSSPAVSAGGP